MFGVYEFPWGTAVKNEDTHEWTNVLLAPSGEMIVVEGLNVTVNDKGVFFVGEDE
jgi:hypothetical protein